MTTFTLELQQFADKVQAKSDDVVGRVVAEISRRVDERSPVGDATYWKNPPPKGYVGGRFRGNWQLGIGSAPSGETGRIDPSGASSQAAIIAEIPTEAAGKVFFIANNVPYGPAIEDGTGSPRQAPQGVVGVTATEFPSIVDQAVESVQ